MSSVARIQGVNPIVAIPFTAQGNVDFASFRRLLAHLSRLGLNGLTLFGIASEFPKLEDEERFHLAEIFLNELVGKGLFRALSVTEHSTDLAVRRARRYQSMGADALMLLPPFFLQPSLTDVQTHIAAVLEAVTIPVMVQYAPGETGFSVTPAQLAEVAKRYPHAVFKIECNPPVDYTREFLQQAPNAHVLNGYAGLYMLQMLKVGGKGVMPGCSFSEIYASIYQHWLAGEHQQAVQLHEALLPYVQRWMQHCEYIIQVEKNILQRRGIITNDYCRKPGWQLTNKDLRIIDSFILQFNLSA